MASVVSLGLHRPSGLHHAIEEQLLPADPPQSSYKWDLWTEDGNHSHLEDELLTTENAVVWSRGSIFRKAFNFELEKEPITQALLAFFPTSEDDQACRTTPQFLDSAENLQHDPALERALVVILQTQAHIHFLSGTNHVVHLPFEVESACAGPVGIILQRRRRAENVAPLSLKFPRVPPNSFVSSHLKAPDASQQTAFSIEGLGRPKPLQLGLGSTLETMWDAPTEQLESHWPRLISLTDPLLEVGLVITEPDANSKKDLRRPKRRTSTFLDPAEEILHIEMITTPSMSKTVDDQGLVLAITFHRDASTYSIWRLTYLRHEDPFLGHHKKSKSRRMARRSSVAPGHGGPAATSSAAGFRESFGAPLPGKKSRKSDKVEKPMDLVSSLEQQDKETTRATRRSSRRVSSMLARADLSTSHDRSSFGEPSILSGHAPSKRHDTQTSHHGRLSSSYSNQIHPSLGSLLEAPLDVGLDEGFHNMGLDDRDLEGLQHEVVFTKIHTVSLDNSNVRYSVSGKPAAQMSKVFILTAPPFATYDQSKSELLIGIQDLIEKRLQLIRLNLKLHPGEDMAIKQDRKALAHGLSIGVTERRVAQNVVDSCKIEDGDQSAILVLSESMDGRHELSTQAPWSELTKISLSLLFTDHTRHLQYRGRVPDRDIKQRKSEVIDLTSGTITGIRYPRQHGIVDAMDTDGRMHQLRIQLEPTQPQIKKILAACRSVLADSSGERIHTGWVHVMQWLQAQDEALFDAEWSALTILLLSSFLCLGRVDSKIASTTRLPMRRRRPPSGTFGSLRESDDWKALETGETANSLGCPVWLMNRGWEWALDGDADDALSPQGDQSPSPKFISKHVSLAKSFLGSALGENALGASGYLPTSLSKSPETRRKAAVDIYLGLHLFSEEQKLNIMTPEYVSPGRADLRVVLCQIARWLRWHNFSSLYELGIQEDVDHRHDSEMILKPPIAQPATRPDILEWIQKSLLGHSPNTYTAPADIFYGDSQLSSSERANDNRWDHIFPATLMFARFFTRLGGDRSAIRMVEAMKASGMTPEKLELLPEAVLVPLRDAISLCQPHPPSTWSKELLSFVNREDISLILTATKQHRPLISSILTPTHQATWDFKLLCQSVEDANNLGFDEGEGTERQAVIRALFSDDRRLNEAQDLLSTHKARLVRLDPQPGWPESEYLEKQKELVARIAIGTLAIPAGRALLYYSLRFPLITQKFHIGGFNLNCVVRPASVTVGVDKALFTEEKVCWGFFHQGVAAGLAISPRAKGIDTSWILYNKPGQDLNNRHAGFLLALGLNGHLKGVAKWVAFKYLTPKHTMTSIGLLLGLAASYIGTMDSLVTRLLSVHATRMLPRGAAELNLSPLTQTSGIMGIGLLYCNSQHRRMSEIMLSEIEHIDDDDEEEPLRSECYRLAAGYALGLINLGKGNDLKGLHDMRLTEKLIAHATAAKDVVIVHMLDRAAAGAVIAITLIFMKTEDQIVARKIDVPASVLQFDYVRPDILLLRTVAKNLILWSQIEPSFFWIQESLPRAYRSRHKLQSTSKLRSTDLSFFSILSGICFSIALRFAGSASTKVRDLLLHYLDQFMRISQIPPSPSMSPDGTPPYDEELARTNARMCQDILALSLGIVMAGTGDIPVLRRLRALHGRDDPDTPYGSHLAAHLAIGALFLGCGTATFGSSNIAIAALLISFYPIFPTNVMDNRSHLQALRHFWVLATEQRCLVAKDILTGQPVSVSVQIKMNPGSSNEPILYRTTPCLLPPLDQISCLSTSCGPQFWDVELDFSNKKLRDAFAETQSIYLKRRPPREGAFSATLRALGRQEPKQDPMEWVFVLQGLRSVSYAEREAVLVNTEDEQEIGGAVDARLEMERGLAEGGDRERLEGARLLFEWGSARDDLLKTTVGAATAMDSQATIQANDDNNDHRHHQPQRSGGGDEEADEPAWWMRDSVIESLKGKVWLAARDAEQ